MEFKTLLVPYDFSPCAARALDTAVALAERFSSKVIVLHVVPPAATVPIEALGAPFGMSLPQVPLQDLLVAREQELETILEPFKKAGGAVVTRVVIGDVADEIQTAITKDSPDLLIVGTHGRTGIGHFLFGSVAEDLVRTATVPVLTIRETAES